MVKRITDLIKIEEVRNWGSGDIITISAPTGSGKSYFIKNLVYLVAKERGENILFLVHRSRCKQQFREELKVDNKLDNVDVVTYQTIEAKKKEFDFSKYSYIVCDEFHYFTSDSQFNYSTDISLNKILGQTDKIRILMSATDRLMKKYINNVKKIDTKDYVVEPNFNWMNLHFYNKDVTINNILNNVVEANEKALVFLSSCERAYELHKDYKKYSLFCCSKDHKRYKYVDEDKISDMLNNEMFEENILFTTTCLDAGINIIDNSIKTIICEIEDIDNIIQCLGRKRRKDGERVNVYIKNINNNVLGGYLGRLKLGLQTCRDLNNLKIKDWTDKYSKEKNEFINTLVYQDGEKNVINEMMKFKILERRYLISVMVGEEGFKGVGFKNYLTKEVFGIEDNVDVEKEVIKDDLENYLDSIVGKKLFKEEQKELKEVFNNAGLKDRTMGINTLRGKLLDEKLPYIIDVPSRKKIKDENGKFKCEKTHWMIKKIVC